MTGICIKFAEPWSWTFDLFENKDLLLYDGDTTGVVIRDDPQWRHYTILLIEKVDEPWSWTYDFVEYKQFLLLYDGDTTGVVIEMTALRSQTAHKQQNHSKYNEKPKHGDP